MLTLDQLKQFAPKAASDRLVLALNSAMLNFKIVSLVERQMFLATLCHESAEFTAYEENLNYSADALVRTWPTRFRRASDAADYGRNPEKIANKVYALRGGNGDEASGDGWRYRGAGFIQLTLKANHASCATAMNKNLADMANWLRTPEGAAMSAAWFWSSRGCGDYANHHDFDGVCDIVNIGRKTTAAGDAIGYINRLTTLQKIQAIIKE